MRTRHTETAIQRIFSGTRRIVARLSGRQIDGGHLQKLNGQRHATSALLLVSLLFVCGAGCGSDSRPELDVVEKAPALDDQQAVEIEASESAAEIESAPQVSRERLRENLLAAVGGAFNKALKDAEGEAGSEARERLREAAQLARRLADVHIDRLLYDFASIEKRGLETRPFLELKRILAEEGVEAGLVWLDGCRDALIGLAREHPENLQAVLIPLLSGACLKGFIGDAGARREFEQLLALDENWPDVLLAFSWYLSDCASAEQVVGKLQDAIVDAERAAELSERLIGRGDESPDAQVSAELALFKWGNFLALRKAPGDFDQAIAAYSRSLELCESLLKADPDSPRELGCVALRLFSLGNLFEERRRSGDLEQAIRHYTRSAETYESLLRINADSARATKELCATLIALGDLLAQRGQLGDAEQASRYFLRDLELCESRLRAQPDSAQALRDVSSSLNTLGRFHSKRGLPGDRELALQYYTRSLEGYESLLKAQPESPREAWDVSAALYGLGTLLAARNQTGDSEQALQFLVRSAELCESVFKANPRSIEAARRAAGAADALGEFFHLRSDPGDIDQAVQHYTRVTEKFELLVEGNPELADLKRGFGVSLLRLAAALRSRGHSGDEDRAMRQLTRSLELSESLLRLSPDSSVAARDVSTCLTILGNLRSSRGGPGDAEEASRYYSRAIEVLEAPLKANPESELAAREVFASIDTMGEFLSVRQQPGDLDQGVRLYERAVEILESASRAHPDSSESIKELANALGSLGNALAARNQAGDRDQALRHYTRVLEISERLREASPDSVQATGDLAFSLNMLGNFLVTRAQPGDAELGIQYCTRSLKLSELQLRANPDSIRAIRDAALTRTLLARFFAALGDAESALRHRRACYELLKPRIDIGIKFDPPVHEMYEKLKQEFEGDQNVEPKSVSHRVFLRVWSIDLRLLVGNDSLRASDFERQFGQKWRTRSELSSSVRCVC